MKLLLVLMAVMSFTVESKTTVSADGIWPYDMSATYANTYNKGQVRANDVATLTVSGLDGITIDAIEVSVKSNKSSGAGTFTVSADGQQIAMKTGSLKDWFGAFNNVDFQALSLLSTPRNNVSELVITLTGTESSLYIDRYTITWSQSQVQTPAYTVTLMKGNSLYAVQTEQTGGAGVMLPKLLDLEDWRFVAWTAAPFEAMNTMPASWIAPGFYHPTEDCTLWAVYEYRPPVSQSIATELQDGAYIYAEWSQQKAMSGGIVDGIAGSADLDISDPNQWYSVTFLTDSTATIQLMYTYEYIGYSGTRLSSELSVWKVYHEGALTAFYTEANNKKYILWPNYLKDMGHGVYEECAALIPTGDISKTSTVLISTEPVMEEPLYSCYPEAQGLDEVTTDETKGEYRMPFGPYDLIIKDGKKYLRIRE